MKIRKICENCGKEYWVPPCRKQTARRCSMKCVKKDKRICKICGQKYIVIPSAKRQTCGERKCTNKLIGVKLSKAILVSCDYCELKISKRPSEIKKNKWSFCNHKCYSKWQKEKQGRMGKKAKCKQCKTEIYRFPVQIKNGTKLYCSQNCFNKGLEKKINIICKSCGSLFFGTPSSKKKYCTDKCRRKSKGISFWAGIIIKCKNCDKKYYIYPYQREHKSNYCSKPCHKEYIGKHRFYPDEAHSTGAKILGWSKEDIIKYKLMPFLELKALQIKLRREVRKNAN